MSAGGQIPHESEPPTRTFRCERCGAEVTGAIDWSRMCHKGCGGDYFEVPAASAGSQEPAPAERERVIREQVDRYEPDLRDLAKVDGASPAKKKREPHVRIPSAEGTLGVPDDVVEAYRDGASPVRDDRTSDHDCHRVSALLWSATSYLPRDQDRREAVADLRALASELARVQDELDQAREALKAERQAMQFAHDLLALIVAETDGDAEANVRGAMATLAAASGVTEKGDGDA